MFIKQKRGIKTYIYEIEDDRNLLLHYFDKEIESLALQAPLVMLIVIKENDRIGYRKKLYKVFRKVNRLTNYTVIIGNSEMLTLSLKELERKL